MDYEVIDSSSTDDDFPTSQYNRLPAGSLVAGNGRPGLSSAPYQRMHGNMEDQIHNLEQEAYGAVLRAFKAQSDALTWEKEGLITELRKELRVSDDEHRELLTRVNADDLIRRIREWRKAGGNHNAMLNIPQPGHEPLPSPTISASHKKQKTFSSVPSSLGTQQIQHQFIEETTEPLTPAAKRGRISETGQRTLPSSRTTQYPITSHGASGAHLINEVTEGTRDPLIGRKVMTRWPEDNGFYEAVISDYNPTTGQHALVYDSSTPNESLEWVNLKEIPLEDIQWVGDDPGISRLAGFRGQNAGRVRGSSRDHFREVRPLQNGVVKASDEIEILHTDTLLKKIEKVFDASHPDLLEIQKAKKMLKEHEQALLDVIAKLSDACNGGLDEEQPFLQAEAMRREHG